MQRRFLAVLAVAAGVLAPSAEAGVDVSSLAAFVRSCSTDSAACHAAVLSAVISARSANYGCIPKEVGNKSAESDVLDWLKAADGNPKYADQPVDDLMWTAIDERWPCPKP